KRADGAGDPGEQVDVHRDSGEHLRFEPTLEVRPGTLVPRHRGSPTTNQTAVLADTETIAISAPKRASPMTSMEPMASAPMDPRGFVWPNSRPITIRPMRYAT